jgi:hypothetical protein
MERAAAHVAVVVLVIFGDTRGTWRGERGEGRREKGGGD